MTDVSSWFYEQLYSFSSKPKGKFFIAGSDHSSRVEKWPAIVVDADKITPGKVSVTLANADGLYSDFYKNLFTMNTSCSFQFGFTHPTSGDEFYDIYTGNVKKIDFLDVTKVKLSIYDKFFDIANIQVGRTDAPASFGAQIPSDIVWTVLTCYGGYSSIESSSNGDIDFDGFSSWAEAFSTDNVTMAAHFTGEKLSEVLKESAETTDSFIWITGEGKFTFARFSEASSLDILIDEGQYSSLKITLDGLNLINKQYVNLNYSVSSDSWADIIFSVNTISVNSFNLHENTIESENLWYVDSVDAISLADRRLGRTANPPRKFDIDIPLFGFLRGVSDTLRFVNSFYDVSSSQGWRISRREIHLDPARMKVKYKTNESYVANGFFLDVHFLDGDEVLL